VDPESGLFKPDHDKMFNFSIAQGNADYYNLRKDMKKTETMAAAYDAKTAGQNEGYGAAQNIAQTQTNMDTITKKTGAKDTDAAKKLGSSAKVSYVDDKGATHDISGTSENVTEKGITYHNNLRHYLEFGAGAEKLREVGVDPHKFVRTMDSINEGSRLVAGTMLALKGGKDITVGTYKGMDKLLSMGNYSPAKRKAIMTALTGAAATFTYTKMSNGPTQEELDKQKTATYNAGMHGQVTKDNG
jgi:hypothetical protein